MNHRHITPATVRKQTYQHLSFPVMIHRAVSLWSMKCKIKKSLFSPTTVKFCSVCWTPTKYIRKKYFQWMSPLYSRVLLHWQRWGHLFSAAVVSLMFMSSCLVISWRLLKRCWLAQMSDHPCLQHFPSTVVQGGSDTTLWLPGIPCRDGMNVFNCFHSKQHVVEMGHPCTCNVSKKQAHTQRVRQRVAD